MSASADFPPQTAPDESLSQVQRVVYTFSGPSKTFTDILRSTSWWLPFLLSVIVTYGVVFSMQTKVGWDKIAENSMKQNPKGAERIASLPPEQQANALKMTVTVTRAISYSIPVFTLVTTAIFALVLWGTINFLFGGKATYGQVFAVWMYGSLPLLIRALLSIVVLFAGVDPDNYNPENPVGTNLGYYLSSEAPKWLGTLATSIDIFWIWSLILVGIGLAIVGKVKRSSGLTAVFLWWLLLLIIRVGYAAISA